MQGTLISVITCPKELIGLDNWGALTVMVMLYLMDPNGQYGLQIQGKTFGVMIIFIAIIWL